MSNKDLRDLYEQVGKSEPGSTRLTDVYRSIYEEQATGGDQMVTVYYSLDTSQDGSASVLQQLQQNNPDTIQARQMSAEYFDNSVVGRLDEKMAKEVKGLVQVVLGADAQFDAVAYRGVYDVFAYNVIPGESVAHYLEARKASKTQDVFLTSVRGVGEQGDVLPVIELLNTNLQINQFIPEGENRAEFLNQLWDVKDVAGRTSVGRGELAMCCFSRCHKGSPGDVVETTAQGKKDDPGAAAEAIKTTRAKLLGDGVKIEVKGKGGRPGKQGFSKKGFTKGIRVLLDTSQSTSGQDHGAVEVDITTIDPMQVSRAEAAVETLFKTSIDSVIKDIEIYFSSPTKGGMDPNNLSVLKTHLMQQAQPTPKDGNWSGWVTEFVNNTAKKTNATVRLALGMTTGSATAKSLPNMYHKLYELLTDASSMITDSMNFKDAVEVFFLQVLPMIPDGALTNAQLAHAIWLTRTEDNTDEHTREAEAEITRMLDHDEISIHSLPDVKVIVGAAQMASYCAADEFTHLMCVDDDAGDMEKNSLVVPCEPTQPGVTFKRLYNAYINYGVEIMLSIDDQNKGCQTKFTQGRSHG